MEEGRLDWLLRELAVTDGMRQDDAFDELYRHFRPRMLARFVGMGLDVHRAQDVFQVAMTKVLINASQYRGESASGWIWMIANREAIDRWNELHGKEQAPLPDDGGLAVPDNPKVGVWDAWDQAGADDPAQFSAGQRRQAVERCVHEQMQAFERDHRERGIAVRLASLEQWSVEAVAQYIGRTPQATRQFLCESRKKMDVYMARCWQLAGEVVTLGDPGAKRTPNQPRGAAT